MLVIGGIVDAGRQQHDRRLACRRGRRDRPKRGEQFVRIVLDRRDAVAREQLGEQPHHDLAVLQHVGDAGGRAGIVLEHVEGVGVDAHDVDAGDLHVDVVRHLLAAHLGAEGGIAEDQIVGHDAGAQDLAGAVDVAEEGVERLDPLGEAFLQGAPFGARHDARDDVEGDEPFLRVGLAVDGEGDADAAEDQLGLAPPVVEHVRRHLGEPARKLAVGRAHLAVEALHFVEGGNHSTSPAVEPAPRDGPRTIGASFRPTKNASGIRYLPGPHAGGRGGCLFFQRRRVGTTGNAGRARAVPRLSGGGEAG